MDLRVVVLLTAAAITFLLTIFHRSILNELQHISFTLDQIERKIKREGS